MRNDLITSLRANQGLFGLDLADDAIERLAVFYDLIQANNEFLNLVGPSTAEEFALRHILESLTLLDYLPQNAKFADVGAGAGLPSIPCLLVREDLRAVLIESKEKKTKFLDTAIEALGLANRVDARRREDRPQDAWPDWRLCLQAIAE